ncbi:TIGR04222 domain-containing membrane protein [Amycolatopsis nalaikhensis]|uniref:TIGR04222 domain-containing membrane protein n=1 Tax=Amycolatopsis nalaikhensis TaxID=715472 RepID=A0ABY8XM68_9PSEU|nr:TIGR04222 domain-containing membrane protein [Amycolatopsis sp. 2-2]WIV56652.1 TIGR04222 domain-containing membrane protein [Amycolatopsis sp. 2-2]
MTDTWGIPGPAFAGLYLGLLLVPALSAAVRAKLLVLGRAGGTPERAEELALLTGGRMRLAELVVARLLEQQSIRLDGSGRLHRVRGTAADELGRAALVRIGKTGASIDGVRTELGQHPAATALESGLVARGLLTDVKKLRSTWVFTAAAYWALVLLGVVRLIAGSASGHPVGYLLGLLALNTVAAVFATVKAANTPEVKATEAGHAAAEEARRAGTLSAGPAGVVASSGFENHPDKDVRLALSRATQPSTARPYSSRRSRWASAGGGAAVGYYGGSSCGGGGSSCGGGGGGCGGGGGGGCGG